MSPRTQRRWTYLGAVLCLVAAGGIWWWAAWLPVELPAAPPTGPQADGRGVSVAQDIDLATLTGLAAVSLRRPLVDRPPPKPPQSRPQPRPPARPARPPVNLRLVGTVLEAGRSNAMLMDGQGQIHVVAEGQSLRVENAEIELRGVQPNSVTVRVAGKDLRLELPPPEPLR